MFVLGLQVYKLIQPLNNQYVMCHFSWACVLPPWKIVWSNELMSFYKGFWKRFQVLSSMNQANFRRIKQGSSRTALAEQWKSKQVLKNVLGERAFYCSHPLNYSGCGNIQMCENCLLFPASRLDQEARLKSVCLQISLQVCSLMLYFDASIYLSLSLSLCLSL